MAVAAKGALAAEVEVAAEEEEVDVEGQLDSKELVCLRPCSCYPCWCGCGCWGGYLA